MFNKNELILDRVRSLTAHSLDTKKLLLRLTSLEEPTLTCTAEGEEVVDAIGAVITTLYRAKRATFAATNSLVSLDLAALQYGTSKTIASKTKKLIDYTYEILSVEKPKEIDKTILTVPDGKTQVCGKSVEEVMSSDCRVLADGSVVGTLKYVSDYEEYDSDPEMCKGNFFIIDLGEKYNGKEISVQRNDQEKPKKVIDTQWLLRVPTQETTFTFKDGEDEIVVLNFKGAKLQTQDSLSMVSVEAVPIDADYVQLSHVPVNVDDIKFIYSIIDGEVGTAYKAGAILSDTEFVIDATGKIAVPTGFTGKVFVEYQYETENAVQVVNSASKFPEAVSLIIYAYFRDKCNENLVYSGKIICPKAKLNPEQVELALTSTGKHSFEFTMMKDYCTEDEDELFTIIVAE